MKKTYIAPKSKEYKVSTQCMIAESIPVGGSGSETPKTDGDGAFTKEEKSGAGIWDLYN